MRALSWVSNSKWYELSGVINIGHISNVKRISVLVIAETLHGACLYTLKLHELKDRNMYIVWCELFFDIKYRQITTILKLRHTLYNLWNVKKIDSYYHKFHYWSNRGLCNT